MNIDLRLKNQIIISIMYKVIGMVISFMFVPILLDFLGKEDYGIWVTISSILTWFMLFDFGIGLGLRNKITKSLALNKIKEAKIYISSAYFIVFMIFISLMFVLLLISNIFDWNSILNIVKYTNIELLKIIQIAIVGFCTLFIFRIVKNLYYAIHQPSTNELIQSISQLVILLALLIISKSVDEYKNLINISIIYTALPIGILIIFSFFFFTKRKDLLPDIYLINFKKGLDITKLGIQFLLLQLSAVILNTIMPFMITKYLGPTNTTEYNIAIKYFGLVQVGLFLVLNPYWSAVTHKYIQNDFEWIWLSLKKTMLWALFGIIIIIGAILVAPIFFKLWVGDNVISINITYWSALFVASFVITQPIITFINGTGQIKQQMYFSVVIIIFLVPIDLILFHYTKLGIGSFLLPPIIFRFIRTIFGFFQLKALLIK